MPPGLAPRAVGGLELCGRNAMYVWPTIVGQNTTRLFLLLVLNTSAGVACAQLQFTEVMYEPGGDPIRWEWVEVRNTSAAAINLDGWIFDDEVLA